VTTPFHHLRPVTVARPADAVDRALRRAALELAAAATADAITGCAALLQRWGCTPTELPTVTAQPSALDEPGSITVRWHGAEPVTAWPATSAHVIVTPLGADASQVTIASSRPSSLGLRESHLDAFHGRRAVDVLLHAFARSLGHHVTRTDAVARPLTEVAP
jgi:hypothetical protein